MIEGLGCWGVEIPKLGSGFKQVKVKSKMGPPFLHEGFVTSTGNSRDSTAATVVNWRHGQG